MVSVDDCLSNPIQPTESEVTGHAPPFPVSTENHFRPRHLSYCLIKNPEMFPLILDDERPASVTESEITSSSGYGGDVDDFCNSDSEESTFFGDETDERKDSSHVMRFLRNHHWNWREINDTLHPSKLVVANKYKPRVQAGLKVSPLPDSSLMSQQTVCISELCESFARLAITEDTPQHKAQDRDQESEHSLENEEDHEVTEITLNLSESRKLIDLPSFEEVELSISQELRENLNKVNLETCNRGIDQINGRKRRHDDDENDVYYIDCDKLAKRW